jgi:hypothetical protein
VPLGAVTLEMPPNIPVRFIARSEPHVPMDSVSPYSNYWTVFRMFA